MAYHENLPWRWTSLCHHLPMHEAADNSAEVLLLLAVLRSFSAEERADMGARAVSRETIAIEEGWPDRVDDRCRAARSDLADVCDRAREAVATIAAAALQKAEPAAHDNLFVTDLALQGDIRELAAGRPMRTNAGPSVGHLLRLISDVESGASAAGDAAEALVLRPYLDDEQVLSILSVIAHALPLPLLEALRFSR